MSPLKYRLDLQFFADEKTEKATPKKRQDVRKKGQTAKSQEINSSIVFLGVFGLLFLMGPSLFQHITAIIRETLQVYIFEEVTENTISLIVIELFSEAVKILGPVMLAAMIAAALANYLQVGFLFTTEPLMVKLERLNPISGFKRIFSLRAVVELLKSLLKVLIIGTIVFSFLKNNLEEVLSLIYQTPHNGLSVISSLTGKVGLYSGIGLLFLALLDYMYQKFDFEKSIRMSKQEIKEELKNTEGNPEIKSKIRQKQREMAMRRMMQEVPKADVVITNPTHYAIALKYDEDQADAPIVVAKGVDYIAQKIKSTAKENDVVIVENRPLARALYAQADIGQAIPESFYKAVAEILAYVYRLQRKV